MNNHCVETKQDENCSFVEKNQDTKCGAMDVTDSGVVGKEKSLECSAAAQAVNGKTEDGSSRDSEVELKLSSCGQLANDGEDASSKFQNVSGNGNGNGNGSPPDVVCLPTTLGIACSSPGDGKCLDPNAPEFTPSSPASSPCLYPHRQRIFSPPVSPHHLYGHMAAIHLNDEMRQQAQALSWPYGSRNCQLQPPPTTRSYYIPTTPCHDHDHGKVFPPAANRASLSLSSRRIRGAMLSSNGGGTRLTIDVSHLQEGFDNGNGIHSFSYATGLTPRNSPRDLAAHYIFDEKAAQLNNGAPRTTLMVRNIPNKYSQVELIKLLDEHCIQQNTQIADSNEAESAYDFVYLPVDFKNRCNLGYGFVNFTSIEGAVRFYKARHFKMWERFNSTKICEISYARLQGQEALEEHFENSVFPCNTEKYLPVKFSTPRNGIQCPLPIPVASHLHLSRKRSPTATNIINTCIDSSNNNNNSTTCENGGGCSKDETSLNQTSEISIM